MHIDSVYFISDERRKKENISYKNKTRVYKYYRFTTMTMKNCFTTIIYVHWTGRIILLFLLDTVTGYGTRILAPQHTITLLTKLGPTFYFYFLYNAGTSLRIYLRVINYDFY